MRILIVDDSSMLRVMLERSLRKWDYDVVSVDNIDAATEQLLNDESIRFVITDWVMPDGDGTILCRRIRELDRPFYVYIIMITAREGSQSLVDGINAGADDFIHKPIHMDELHARIQAGERVLQLEQSLQERNVMLSEFSENLLAAQNIIHSELQFAEKIQRKLLPTHLSSNQGIAIDGLFCPSGNVSGDIYNFFRVDENHIFFYTIDVAGHGIAAAMMSFALSQLLTPSKDTSENSPYLNTNEPSSASVAKLNNRFQTDATNMLYFTMIYGVINTKLRTIDLCQAGHPNPIYLPKAGAARFIGDGGFPVGITPIAEYESLCLNYHDGDKLFFYSDGITECMNASGEMFGDERLLAFIEETRNLPIGEMLASLEKQMRAWRGEDKFDDDISMLALEIDCDTFASVQ